MPGAFLYDNRITAEAGLSASVPVPAAMPVENLLDPQPRRRARLLASAASLTVDLRASAAVDCLALLSTNLTPAATVRWRVGALESFAEPTSYSLDNTEGATIGPNTMRVGSATAADGSSVPVYRNSATSQSYVQRNVTLAANVRYRWTVRAMRVAGSGTTGQIISAVYHDGTGTTRANLSMSALPLTGEADLSVEFLNRVAGTYAMYMFTFVGPEGGDVALWNGRLTPIAEYDSGTILAETGPDAGGNVILVSPASASGQYFRMDLSDGSLPYIDVGRVVAGPLWRPRWAMEYGVREGRLILDRRDRNPFTGAEFPTRAVANPRTVTFTLPIAANSELHSAHRELVEKLGAAGDALWIPELSLSLSERNRRSIWGAVNAAGEEAVSEHVAYSLARRQFRMVERL